MEGAINIRRTQTMSLVYLIREQFDTDSSVSEWHFSDYTKGHLIIVAIFMFLSYLCQLLGLVFLVLVINSSTLNEIDSNFAVEPYLECCEICIVVILVHFQFYTFWTDPIRILEIISKRLHYANITMTVCYAALIGSLYLGNSDFINIIRMSSCLTILCLAGFIYVHVRKAIREHSHNSWGQIIGFNILYSLTLSFLLLEAANYSFVALMDETSFFLCPDSAVIGFMTFYFSLAAFSLFWLKDIYIGLGVALNNFGIFMLQRINICENKISNCSSQVQTFALIFSFATLFFTLITLYFYPQSYKYQDDKIKSKSEILSK